MNSLTIPFMRCFVAVDIDSALRTKITSLQSQLGTQGIKLIHPEALHFTLKFLGEIDEDTVSKVKESLDFLKDYKAFEIDLKGTGAFPDVNYARVVWIGAEKLLNLQNQVNELLSPLFPKDLDVKPHLTIARVKLLKDRKKLQGFINQNSNIEIGSMTVNEDFLKKSTLTTEGPVYENLSSFKLKS